MGNDEMIPEEHDRFRSTCLRELEKRGIPGHMTPGAALVSEDIKAPTLVMFIQELDKAIVTRCRAILEDLDLFTIENRSAEEIAKIQYQARSIISA
jgi:hypothetical protein